MWMGGNDSYKSINFTFNLMITNKSLEVFTNMLKFILNMDTAILNFCAVKKTLTTKDREEIIDRLVTDINAPFPGEDTREAEALPNRIPGGSIPAPVYNGTTDNIFPENRPNAFPLNASPFFQDAYNKVINRSFEFAQPGETIRLANETVDPAFAQVQDMTKSCGNELRALLGNVIDDFYKSYGGISSEINAALKSNG
jgi:hypothetical protein